jgi:hypothetical protein
MGWPRLEGVDEFDMARLSTLITMSKLWNRTPLKGGVVSFI